MHYPVNSFSSGQTPDGTVDARSFHYVIVNVNAMQRILLIQRPLEQSHKGLSIANPVSIELHKGAQREWEIVLPLLGVKKMEDSGLEPLTY